MRLQDLTMNETNGFLRSVSLFGNKSLTLNDLYVLYADLHFTSGTIWLKYLLMCIIILYG